MIHRWGCFLLQKPFFAGLDIDLGWRLMSYHPFFALLCLRCSFDLQKLL